MPPTLTAPGILETESLPRHQLTLRVDPFAASDAPEYEGAYLGFQARWNLMKSPPCDHGCPWRERCATEPLACAAFNEYVKTGKAMRSLGDRPTRRRYQALFSD